MTNKNINTKKGFTIIEVVLVLAIAGLIFLMVFVALPALQRSQRDTQRRDDYGMLSSAITNYSANNGGRLYKLAGASAATENKNYTLDAKRYINNEGKDPNGADYILKAYTWAAWKAYTGSNDTGAYTKEDTVIFPNSRDVFVIINADCTGAAKGHDAPKYNSSTRSFAIFGYLESGNGTYCSASQ